MNKFIDRIRQKAIRKLGGYVEPFPGPQQQLFEYRTVCAPVVLKAGCTVRYDCPEERVKDMLTLQLANTLREEGYIKPIRTNGSFVGTVDYLVYLKVIKED